MATRTEWMISFFRSVCHWDVRCVLWWVVSLMLSITQWNVRDRWDQKNDTDELYTVRQYTFDTLN